MPITALFITHRTQPGQRAAVQRIWEQYLQPQIAANPNHLFYAYCADDSDPDLLCVFQLYTDAAAAQSFLDGPWYAPYVAAVSPFLAGPPAIRTATPHWIKGLPNASLTPAEADE